MIWAGLQGPGREPLIELAARLERALAPLGFPPEGRPLTPHVTLGRVKAERGRRASRSTPRGLADVVGGIELPAEGSREDRATFAAAELVLFESSHGRAGGPPTYTARARVALGTY